MPVICVGRPGAAHAHVQHDFISDPRFGSFLGSFQIAPRLNKDLFQHNLVRSLLRSKCDIICGPTLNAINCERSCFPRCLTPSCFVVVFDPVSRQESCARGRQLLRAPTERKKVEEANFGLGSSSKGRMGNEFDNYRNRYQVARFGSIHLLGWLKSNNSKVSLKLADFSHLIQSRLVANLMVEIYSWPEMSWF